MSKDNAEAKDLYNYQERSFFALKTGKTVARLDDQNNVIFEPGMLPAHKRKLSEWLDANGMSFPNLPEKNDDVPVAGLSESSVVAENNENMEDAGKKPKESQEKRLAVADIPEDMLPRFDKALGIRTPGLMEFMDYHKLDGAARSALIRRLERR